MQTLDSFLPRALTTISNNLRRLQNRRLTQEISQEAGRLFLDDFKQIEEVVMGSVEIPKTVFKRTTSEVRLILGIA